MRTQELGATDLCARDEFAPQRRRIRHELVAKQGRGVTDSPLLFVEAEQALEGLIEMWTGRRVGTDGRPMRLQGQTERGLGFNGVAHLLVECGEVFVHDTQEEVVGREFRKGDLDRVHVGRFSISPSLEVAIANAQDVRGAHDCDGIAGRLVHRKRGGKYGDGELGLAIV